MTELQKQIVLEASKYLHVREITPNKGFTDKSFEGKMRACGWRPSYAWCSTFSELVWKEVFSKFCPEHLEKITKNIQPGVMNT